MAGEIQPFLIAKYNVHAFNATLPLPRRLVGFAAAAPVP